MVRQCFGLSRQSSSHPPFRFEPFGNENHPDGLALDQAAAYRHGLIRILKRKRMIKILPNLVASQKGLVCVAQERSTTFANDHVFIHEVGIGMVVEKIDNRLPDDGADVDVGEPVGPFMGEQANAFVLNHVSAANRRREFTGGGCWRFECEGVGRGSVGLGESEQATLV